MHTPRKIVIVDDDLEFLQELSELMVSNGYKVSTCGDGESALNMIPKIMPDLVLLDLKMNKLNGFQVAAKLKSAPGTRDIPIIAVTGYYTQEEYSLMMKLFGVKKFIIKPIDPDKIANEVENALSDEGK